MATTCKKATTTAAAQKVLSVTIEVPLDQLKQHPQQIAIFGIPTDAEIAQLAADIRDRGLQQPIELSPDNTILSGHKRVEAAKLNGKTSIKAVIRHDLAALGRVAMDRHFLAENFFRRHLTGLARARCAREMVNLKLRGESVDNDNGDSSMGNVEARKAVAELLGISDHQVSRLLAVLNAPLEVQQSYENGEISLVMAGKVASLNSMQQARVAAAIRSGKSPGAAISALTTKARADTQSDQPGYARLLDELDTIVRSLEMIAEANHRDAQSRSRIRRLACCIAVLERLVQRERRGPSSSIAGDSAGRPDLPPGTTPTDCAPMEMK